MSLLGWVVGAASEEGGRADARRSRTLCWARRSRTLCGARRSWALRFARGEGFVREIDHLVATGVERRFVGLFRVGRVEREKKHSPLGAEALFLARWMPARAEALRRQNDIGAAGLGNGVPAGFFKRAHEGRDASAARADARSLGEKRFCLGRFERGRAMAFEGVKNGQVQYLEVAVAEPVLSEKLDFPNRLEVARVFAAQPGARRVFANVAAKRRKLAALLHDPVVPLGLEDGRGRLRGRLRGRATCKTLCGGVWKWGFARCGVCRNNLPIGIAKRFGKLADQNPKRDAIWNIANLDEQMDVVGHDHERRDLVKATPFDVEALDDRDKDLGDFVFNQASRPEMGKVSQPLESFQGDHVEKGRLVVKTEETGHKDIIAEARWQTPSHCNAR